ncbi:MAG TPA: DUF2142 domain-containing protein, partial [Actinomycetota bacterium]|nr:DUF2142 domain-containing protein [Actinomycetota bacterium]
MTSGSSRHSRALRATRLLVVVGFTLLVMAWMFGTPPGAGPDELAHYVKAVGAGGGDIRGGEIPEATMGPPPSATQAWFNQTSRVFDVPPRLSTARLECVTFFRVPGDCPPIQGGQGSELSHVGTYQPWSYVLPGVAAGMSGDAPAALRAGRAISAAVCLALLCAAAALLWDPRNAGASVAGLLVGVSPMVLFVMSQLSGSGPELAGTICLAAALIHLSREAPSSRWAWLAAGAGAVLAVSTRSLGPLWVLLCVAGVTVAFGGRRLLSEVKSGGRGAKAAIVATVAAGAAGVWWEAAFQPHPGFSLSRTIRNLPSAAYSMVDVGEQSIGIFGSLDVRVRPGFYVLWAILLLVVLGLALLWGRPRERMALAGLSAGAVGFSVVLAAAVVIPTGFGLQGRHVLPAAVPVPLIAGEVLSRAVARRKRPGADARFSSRAAAAVTVWVAAIAAALHGLAWMTNARRYAFGQPVSWDLLGSAAWAPPGGWLPWILLVCAGCGCLALSGVTASGLAGAPRGT